MRTVDWTRWIHKIVTAAILVYFRVSGIHPAAVKCPVSASLVGRSSHVKLSVRSIARSILCCRNLRQRNQTVNSCSLNVEMWAFKFFANKIVKSVYYICVWCESHYCFHCYMTLQQCNWYQDLAFEQYKFSVPKRRCLITLSNALPSVLL